MFERRQEKIVEIVSNWLFQMIRPTIHKLHTCRVGNVCNACVRLCNASTMVWPGEAGSLEKNILVVFQKWQKCPKFQKFHFENHFFLEIWSSDFREEEKRKKKWKKKKKGEDRKKKKKGKKFSLSHVDQIVWLHSEPSEREARTTCERPVQKKFVTLPKTQRPTLLYR